MARAAVARAEGTAAAAGTASDSLVTAQPGATKAETNGQGAASDPRTAQALAWIHLLASEIGPRRPTSEAERRAAERMRDELRAAGVAAELEPFRGYSSFGLPYGLILATATLAGALRRRPALSAALGAAATGALATEGELVKTPLSDLLARRDSQNVIATIDPSGAAARTLCIVCHLDSSRSGLMFDPRLGRLPDLLRPLLGVTVPLQAITPVLARSRLGRAIRAAGTATVAAALMLLLERELRGEDVPGANDNASGAAIAAVLATECAVRPLETTRVVLLMTGCEESGLLGAQAFLRSRDTTGWLFLNFDSVGGPATLRYLRSEGVLRRWPADRSLVELAEATSRRRPELGLEATDHPAGLTYDVTAVLARGGRGLSLSAQDATIPNYHTPSDTPENIDPDVVARTLETGREMIAAIDRGEAD